MCVCARGWRRGEWVPKVCIKYLSSYYATRFGVGTKFCGIDDVKLYANSSHLEIFTRFILYIILKNMPELT